MIRSPRESHKKVETLRDSGARFRATFENAAVGIARVAPDGCWLEVNQRLCDIVGYTHKELMTKTFGDITHPDDLESDWNQARRLLAGEIENYSLEKRYYRKDGSIVWVNKTVSLARKANGAPDYFVSIIEDISARKRLDCSPTWAPLWPSTRRRCKACCKRALKPWSGIWTQRLRASGR